MARELYKDEFGKALPSVTTILSKFKDSGGLIYWANQQGLAGKTLDEARQAAVGPGTLAHEMVFANLRGEIGNDANKIDGWHGADPEILTKAISGFSNYLNWKEMTKIEFQHAEFPLTSKKHRFGGKPDALAVVLGKKRVLCDWKNANAIYADNLYQLAGYKILWEENYPDMPIEGFELCRFSKDGGDFSHHHFDNLDKEAEIFLTMRKLYDAVKETEKRVK